MLPESQLPLLALPLTGIKRVRSQERKLVLVLGGVSHCDDPWYAINTLYRRLSENKTDAVEVVVVDPDEWLHGDAGGVTHIKMTLDEFIKRHPLQDLQRSYDQIAVVDDIMFKIVREREAITSSDAWTALADMVDKNADTCSWWVFHTKDELWRLSNVKNKHGGTYTIRTANHLRFVVSLQSLTTILKHPFMMPAIPEALFGKCVVL